jgi:hypothetical protein
MWRSALQILVVIKRRSSSKLLKFDARPAVGFLAQRRERIEGSINTYGSACSRVPRVTKRQHVIQEEEFIAKSAILRFCKKKDVKN